MRVNFTSTFHSQFTALANSPSYIHIMFLYLFDPTTEGARAALNLAGTMLGYYPVRVLPSKTAIAPVNPTFLPRVSKTLSFCF